MQCIDLVAHSFPSCAMQALKLRGEACPSVHAGDTVNEPTRLLYIKPTCAEVQKEWARSTNSCPDNTPRRHTHDMRASDAGEVHDRGDL